MRATSAGVRAAPRAAVRACSVRICSNERRPRAAIVSPRSRRAERRSSAIVMRSLPMRLASYSAASAATSRSRSVSPSCGNDGHADRDREAPAVEVDGGQRALQAAADRAGVRLASSPAGAARTPRRRAGRRGRPAARRRRAGAPTMRSASSPATWPRRSLRSLKSSRSADHHGEGRRRGAGRVQQRRAVLVEAAVVRQAGQRVGERRGDDVLVALQVAERRAGLRGEQLRALVLRRAGSCRSLRAAPTSRPDHLAARPQRQHDDRGVPARRARRAGAGPMPSASAWAGSQLRAAASADGLRRLAAPGCERIVRRHSRQRLQVVLRARPARAPSRAAAPRRPGARSAPAASARRAARRAARRSARAR